MYTPFLFAILSTSLYYLGSRATITSWLWSKYPTNFAKFMDCPMCVGFWFGLGLSLFFGELNHSNLSYMGLPVNNLITYLIIGFCSIVLTPITAGFMQAGLDRLGTIDNGQST